MNLARNLKPIVKGAATFVLPPALLRRGGDGSATADYCYSVLLRHGARLKALGLEPFSGTVAELGPGASLGVGIGALILGADEYVGLDLHNYDCWAKNQPLFDELLALLRSKAPIPSGDNLDKIGPSLPSLKFPDFVSTNFPLERLQYVRENIAAPGKTMRYAAPWMDANIVPAASIHWIFSQAVLEHVDDLDGTYAAAFRALEPGGFMSHQIDMKSHGFAADWNGHWAYPDPLWKIVRGRRAYALNRATAGMHIALMEKHGFEIVQADRQIRDDGLPKEKLAVRYQAVPDEDLRTAGLFVVARKRG